VSRPGVRLLVSVIAGPHATTVCCSMAASTTQKASRVSRINSPRPGQHPAARLAINAVIREPALPEDRGGRHRAPVRERLTEAGIRVVQTPVLSENSIEPSCGSMIVTEEPTKSLAATNGAVSTWWCEAFWRKLHHGGGSADLALLAEVASLAEMSHAE
jgi:hypothetical protein